MKRDFFKLQLIGLFLLTILAQPVHAENVGRFLDGIIPGFLFTVLGGYVFIVGLVLTFKGFRSTALTVLSVIVSLALSVFFLSNVWNSDFCSPAHPLFILPLSFCQQLVLLWLCLLPFLIGLPIAQCYAWHAEHASHRGMLWCIAIPGIIVWGLVGGNLVWGNRLDALIDALTDPNRFARAKAVHALARSTDPRSIAPLLTTAVHDKDDGVRIYARRALIQIGVPAIAPLSTILQGGDKTSHNVIKDILMHIDDPQVVEPLLLAGGLKDKRNHRADRLVLSRLVSIGVPAVEPLIAILEDKNNTFTNREQAAEALGKIGDSRAIIPLSDALRDSITNVSWKAAVALRTIGNAQAFDALIAALNDHQLQCRWCVVSPFMIASPEPGKPLTDPRVVEPLIAILTSNDGDLSTRAELALRNIGAPAIEPLSARLNDNDQSVRLAACRVLRKIGDNPAVGPLITTLKDNDESGDVGRCLQQ